MDRSKLIVLSAATVAIIVVAAASYSYGLHTGRIGESRNLASVQAMLAFGHHKSYERLESLLTRKCYEAALTEALQLKDLQVSLVSDNLRASGNDPEVTEYIKKRDPKLLQEISAGRIPAVKSYTTTCP